MCFWSWNREGFLKTEGGEKTTHTQIFNCHYMKCKIKRQKWQTEQKVKWKPLWFKKDSHRSVRNENPRRETARNYKSSNLEKKKYNGQLQNILKMIQLYLKSNQCKIEKYHLNSSDQQNVNEKRMKLPDVGESKMEMNAVLRAGEPTRL